MEQREMEVTVLSAKDLNKVNLIGKMDVYIIVFISGSKSNHKVKTPVDIDGGSNPTWNFQTKFIIDEAGAHQNDTTIVFKVKCERALGDKDIGEVQVPIKELLQSPEAIEGKKQFVSYQVRKPDGKPKGLINFAYQFGGKVGKAEEHPTMMAYPPPHGVGSSSMYPQHAPVYPPPPAGSYPPRPHSEGYPPPPTHSDGGNPSNGGYPPSHYSVHYSEGYPPPAKHSEGGYPPHHHSEGYPPPKHSEGGYPPPKYHGAPPPQVGYPHPPPQYAGYGYQPPQHYGGYPPPPPPGHGYPPQQPGYGYAPHAQHPPKKNNKAGLGLGAGLLGGALGGLIIGDMISDGFGDVGFDF